MSTNRQVSKRTITYVIGPRPASSTPTHLLGVNSLAFDPQAACLDSGGDLPETHAPHSPTQGVLYSAGRDGLTLAWDLNFPTGPTGDIDRTTLKTKGLRPAYRCASQHHADWVNDITLCANNQALASASSDRTIKLWRPRPSGGGGTLPPTVTTVGYHTDYVKSLAHASGPQWLASGGLDRRIHLWDLAAQRNAPIVTFALSRSVYALSTNPQGSLLVSGSPEKTVRVWDPRSGRAVTNLTGHTDNIRTVLLSQDGELILSGSSDTTIKLWSLTAGRCIATYTYHSDSVWSLFSDHPRLSYFYSGGKDGLIAKTLTNGVTFTTPESVAIARESTGIVKLVALNNHYIWTATQSSDIKCWRDIRYDQPQLQSPLANQPDFAHLSMDSPHNSRLIPPGRSSNLESQSVRTFSQSPPSPVPPAAMLSAESESTVVREAPDNIIRGDHGLIRSHVLNNKYQAVALDTSGIVSLWDIIRCR
ncbi:WD40-repeat-containing domain protein, partial [Dimargaris cristalligena]